MASTRDVMVYFLLQYPHKDELSNARLTKMVYLADWKHVLKRQGQITPIRWFYNNFGPYVDDVLNAAVTDTETFSVEDTINLFGEAKRLIRLTSMEPHHTLNPEEIATLNHVISTTKNLNWDDFIRLVYSTFPIVNSPKFEYLDLDVQYRQYVEFQETTTEH